jgi:hypothetical protein
LSTVSFRGKDIAVVPNASDAETLRDKLFSVSRLAGAVQHILKSIEGGEEQRLLNAINLCGMIEGIAQAEANRADKLAVGLSQLQTRK